MTVVLYYALYAGGLIFLAGCVIRAVLYARMPVHLRWELHPLPHNRREALGAMASEILLFRTLWKSNRGLWYSSYPFHLGLYLTVTGVVSDIAGWCGLALVLAGSTGLLIRRLGPLRAFSNSGDILNAALFATTSALLLAGCLLRPAGTPGPRAILVGAMKFDALLAPTAFLAGAMIAASALLAYIPMTHMAHFIGKFFAFHSVRWDDRPGVTASAELAYRPTWSAAHMRADGRRTWAEIARMDPE